MGKKKRILINPKKFGKKHFEFLDNLDGTDDNVISSTLVPATIRTLNLVDNGDRTVSISAEAYGSGSAIQAMGYVIQMSGGVAVSADINSDESMAIASSGSTGFLYNSALPAIVDDNNPGEILVFPAGKVTIKALLSSSAGGTAVPGLYADHSSAVATLTNSITVGSAPIGLTSTMLSGALSGNVGSSWDGSEALSIDLDSFIGSGPQHGSGSGVGSSATYNVKDESHGFLVAVSGAANGALTLTTSTANNGHALSGVVELLSGSQVEALTPETLTVTFTPRDVNNALSTDQAVTFDITVID